mmetsp:Transcript_18324/g.24478  ORF Transcript_18324/g.24478 Transcript_18324/m.24478 type:complete len:197 (+) Transcript_18324:1784-2374(+)
MVARQEADAVNKQTLKAHDRQKKHSVETKARFGRQNNSYAPDSLRMAAFGDQIAKQRGSSMGSAGLRAGHPLSMTAKDMPNSTGNTRMNADRLTTIRQVRHYEDNLRRIEEDRAKKVQLRADLEKQVQAKVFKRERERLLMDNKALVTSKGLLQSVGARVHDVRPAEETTDMGLLRDDEEHVDTQVRHLQQIASSL